MTGQPTHGADYDDYADIHTHTNTDTHTHTHIFTMTKHTARIGIKQANQISGDVTNGV